MFYALAHLEEEFFVDNMYKFLAFAPCTICPKNGPEEKWQDTLFQYPSIGVYEMYGPGWDEDYKKVCRKLG